MATKESIAGAGKTLRHLLKVMSRRFTAKRVLVSAAAVVLGTALAFAASYFWPRTVQFAYAGQTCFANPVLLPNLTTSQNSQSFKAELKPAVLVGSYPLFSHQTCITPTAPPKTNTQETLALAPFGNSLIKKNITLKTAGAPAVTAKIVADKPLPTKEPLAFTLSEADQVYAYKLGANNKAVTCPQADRQVRCDLTGLGLAQSTAYEFVLAREFNGKLTETVFKKAMTTIEALGVVNTSIGSGQKVFGVPTDITLTLNKPVSKIEGIAMEVVAPDGKRQPFPVTHAVQNGAVVVTFAQALPRSVSFELKIATLESADGAYAPGGFAMWFSTSGGPKVTNINIPQSRVSVGSRIVLTFDSILGAGQPYQQFIHLSTPGGLVAANVTASGNTATIIPATPLPACTPITVKVIDGIKSDVGVTGGSAWQYGARTLCQTAFSIGTSVKGRSIMAYRFGSGPSRMVLVGAMHGNEKSSAYTLHSLIDYLEANPAQLPAHRTVTIIPIANPDGYAVNSRFNANNVDLNRNFAANNWKSSVTVPGGTFPQGGGASPMDQPESKALGNYTLSQSPRLVLSYHSVGPLAAANEAKDSRALATTYGQLARIPSYGNDGNSNFDYDTTGAYDDWLADKYGIGSILIELSTHTGNEFNRHRTAIMAMLQIP